MLAGRTPVLPGKPVAVSMIEPVLQEWWLRPVSRAMRVGEHRAVVWKRLYFSPLLASFSQVGMWIGPPKALDWPKPMSSIRTMTTLGAPFGALTSKRGGALALRASTSVMGLSLGSGIGRTVRSSLSEAALSASFAASAGFPDRAWTSAVSCPDAAR